MGRKTQNIISFAVTPEFQAQLTEIASSQGLSLSAFCNHAMSTYVGFGDQAVYDQARILAYYFARRMLRQAHESMPGTIEEAQAMGYLNALPALTGG